MTIHWASLLAVFAVALGSTLAVVVLVTLALVALSTRTGPQRCSPFHDQRGMGRPSGTSAADR
jgi:hypothetical protein